MTLELSYLQLKTSNEARLSVCTHLILPAVISHPQEEVISEQRKRNILILVRHHLQEHGYIYILQATKANITYRYLDTVQILDKEVGQTLKKYEVCDNIDLTTILQVRYDCILYYTIQ